MMLYLLKMVIFHFATLNCQRLTNEDLTNKQPPMSSWLIPNFMHKGKHHLEMFEMEDIFKGNGKHPQLNRI